MSKHLDNLEILSNKMRARYGESDDLVRQLTQEISALKEKKTKDLVMKGLGRHADEKLETAYPVH